MTPATQSQTTSLSGAREDNLQNLHVASTCTNYESLNEKNKPTWIKELAATVGDTEVSSLNRVNVRLQKGKCLFKGGEW